jgi:uncharacterized phage protein (TIGR02220 family)
MEGRQKGMEKSAFLFYYDWWDIIKGYDSKQVKQLLGLLCGEIEIMENADPAALTAFQFMSSVVRRNKEKYTETCKRRAEAGKKGGQATQANAIKNKQVKANQANQADNDPDPDPDPDLKKERHCAADDLFEGAGESSKPDPVQELIKAIIFYLNSKVDAEFSPDAKETQKLLKTIIKNHRGITLNLFEQVIDHKYDEWYEDANMRERLVPATLFAYKNFSKYVQQLQLKGRG